MGGDGRRDDFVGAHLSYEKGALDEVGAGDDPEELFGSWLADAIAAEVTEPTTMIVSSLRSDGGPTARAVLLRRLDDGWLEFFTNLHSAKGRELAAEPRCSALFVWLDLNRQVRAVGRARAVPDDEADEYFAGRARGSQIGAWASPQSEVIADRAELDARVAAAEERFAGDERIPRPPHWGGYRVEVDEWEFWQGRADRLHDRIRFRRSERRVWIRERLAP